MIHTAIKPIYDNHGICPESSYVCSYYQELKNHDGVWNKDYYDLYLFKEASGRKAVILRFSGENSWDFSYFHLSDLLSFRGYSIKYDNILRMLTFYDKIPT